MAEKPAYDLLVLIDADAPEERRTGIVDAIKKQIQSGDAELKGDSDWGVRKLAYEIEHRPEAHYHLFQLEASPEVLKQLDHSLSIDDVVLRHRLIRLPGAAPETPPKPAPTGPRQQVQPEAREQSEPSPREQSEPSPAPEPRSA
jgi:small subunit ribosomal protein S6